jgi:hypothetical protein
MAEQRIGLRLKIWVGTPHRKRLIYDQPAHSIIGNFLAMLACQMRQGGSLCSIKDISANTFFPSVQSYTFNCAGAIGDGILGICVGRGDTAVTMLDYYLALPISHGTTLNKLYYNLQSWSPVAKTLTQWEMAVTRTFTNQSGAPIDVKESCIIFNIGNASGGATYVMGIRDVFATITVPDAKVLTIQYTIAIPLL